MKRLRTVFVDRDGTKVMINASAFDPRKDKLWSEDSGSDDGTASKKASKKKASKKKASKK